MRYTYTKILIVLWLVFVLLTIMTSCQVNWPDISIFASISECEAIADHASKDIHINAISVSDSDRFLKSLKPKESFACEYISEQFSFTLYAYTFENIDDAQKYFYNATGKRNDPTTTFCDSSGLMYFERIVADEANVYRIVSSNKHSEEAVAYINSVFSKTLFSSIRLARKTGDGSLS